MAPDERHPRFALDRFAPDGRQHEFSSRHRKTSRSVQNDHTRTGRRIAAGSGMAPRVRAGARALTPIVRGPVEGNTSSPRCVVSTYVEKGGPMRHEPDVYGSSTILERRLATLTCGTAVLIVLLAAQVHAHVFLDRPNGGEVLEVGSVYTIVWGDEVSHGPADYDLWYSTTGPDGPWITIAKRSSTFRIGYHVLRLGGPRCTVQPGTGQGATGQRRRGLSGRQRIGPGHRE